LAAGQPERAESLLRAALSVDASNGGAQALLLDAVQSARLQRHGGDASAAVQAAERALVRTLSVESGERARLLVNAAASAHEAQEAAAAIASEFGADSVYHALALSNVGVWQARARAVDDAVRTLQTARALLLRAVGADHGLHAAVDANLRVLGVDVAALGADADADAVVCDVDVAAAERLDERAQLWARQALPGRCDPDGVLMDANFTRRVLAHFFARQPALAGDGRLFEWLANESTTHSAFEAEQQQQQQQQQEQLQPEQNVAKP
jgi:hypothetical protein